jgi:hypothetical protein
MEFKAPVENSRLRKSQLCTCTLSSEIHVFASCASSKNISYKVYVFHDPVGIHHTWHHKNVFFLFLCFQISAMQREMLGPHFRASCWVMVTGSKPPTDQPGAIIATYMHNGRQQRDHPAGSPQIERRVFLPRMKVEATRLWLEAHNSSRTGGLALYVRTESYRLHG